MTPDPEMLCISASPAGGTGDFGFAVIGFAMLTGLPKEGQAGRFFSVRFIVYINTYF